MKLIIGIILCYVIYFVVVIVLDLIKKNKKENRDDNETIIDVKPEKTNPIDVIGEYEKKK